MDIASSLSSLKIVWLCGEVVTTALRDRCMKALPQVKLVNLYSISECHDVAVADLTDLPFQDEVRAVLHSEVTVSLTVHITVG